MSFALKREQSLRKNIRRIVRKQLDDASDKLTENRNGSRDDAVHEVRKHLKKVRAVLRFVRSEIGAKVYRAENALLRDAARPLSEVRDAKIFIETVDALAEHFKEQVAGPRFNEIRKALQDNLRAVRARILDEQNAFTLTADSIRKASERVSDWARVPNRWSALGQGLEDTYRRGRAAYEEAHGERSIETLHEWRKQAKYLRHQLEVLVPIWPERLKELAEKADRMAELLGDDHDLSALRHFFDWWDQLLESIDDQRVIPIIGPDLLQVEVDGETMLLDQHIACRLARKNRLPEGNLTAERPLNFVVCQLLRSGKDRDRIGADIYQIMKEANFQPSEPLRQLARIRNFNLFVTTTFDGLLEKAIKEVRPEGTMAITYSLEDPNDLPCRKINLPRPTVYYLMGRLKANPNYVISEEDLLEYVCQLQNEARHPETLLEELKANHLLILGGNYSDWLARFFLRTAKGGRLSTTHGFEILADDNTHRDRGLVSFLLHFRKGARVFRAGGRSGGAVGLAEELWKEDAEQPLRQRQGEAVEFVGELWKRWSLRQRPPGPEKPGQIPHNAIFISYAREDQEAAHQLNAGLEKAGLPVWLDRERLGPGDTWRHQIEQYIMKGCGCFLALVSKNTERRKEGEFRREWSLAIERDKGIQGKRFIMPIVVDDTFQPEVVPPRFSELNFTWLPDGKVTPPFVEELRKALRCS